MSRLQKALAAALLLLSGPFFATIPASAQDQGDPPADVARIAIISGSVSAHQPGSQDWEGAEQNYPLAPGSGVWAEPRSHAAVDVAGARVHLDGSSQLEVTAINQGQVQLSVPQGAAYVHVYPGSSGVSFQIDTAHGSATINQPGQYEIVAGDDQNPSTLSVIEGQAQFVGQNANLALQPGQRGTITPDNQSAVDAAQPDDFVRLVQQQEQPYQQQMAQTAQYVSPQQPGYQDLARYGQWSQAPQYGAVWYPQAVPAGWAPYRYGHWAYVAPWGWTWVDDAPWGFTPFHYGRWVQVGPRWGWVPGARVERPVYAPALVSFFGNLGGVGIDVSVGWVPLAPNEVYVPYYRHSQRYVREVNITNVHNETTIINVVNKKTVINYNNYANYRGATSAPRDVMEHGRAVGPAWSKNNRTKADQQWAHAKPEQQPSFQPQDNAGMKRGSGPKFNPQQQHQNGQANAKPNGNQPKMPAPPPQASKSWNNNGKPKDYSAKPKNGTQPYVPPVSGTSQNFDAPQPKWQKPKSQGAAPTTTANIPAPPKSSKNKKNQQPPAIYPAAAPKPVVQQPQAQEQTSKKAQWKAQQQPQQPQDQTSRKAQWKAQQQQQPQVQQQPRQSQQQSKTQWKQQGQPKPNQHSEKAPKANPVPAQQQNPQQKKPDCGQPGACQQ